MNTVEKLNKLYGLQIQREKRLLDKQELIDSVIPAEVKAKIAEIEAEYAENDFISDTITALEKEIKADVEARRETVKGNYLMVTYSGGRTSWDNKGLEGYALAHPEINVFKKTGDPILTLRKVAK